MGDYLKYALYANCCIAIFYLLYIVFLRKETFYTFNRIFILTTVALSFIIPVIPISKSLIFNEKVMTISASAGKFVSPDGIDISSRQMTDEIAVSKASPKTNYIQIVYFAGAFLVLIAVIFNFAKIAVLTQNSEVNVLGKHRLYISKVKSNFSFFNKIFVSGQQFSAPGLTYIIQHEKIHARYFHSIDLLILEIIKILFWFNPFIYLLKRAVKENHEFFVDSQFKKSGADFSPYLNKLFASVNEQSFSGAASYFNKSILKNRIQMISKNASPKIRLLKYFAVIPAFVLLAAVFGKTPVKVERGPKVSIMNDILFFKVFNYNTSDIKDIQIINNPKVSAILVTLAENSKISVRKKVTIKEVNSLSDNSKEIIIVDGKGNNLIIKNLYDFDFERGHVFNPSDSFTLVQAENKKNSIIIENESLNDTRGIIVKISGK